MKTGSLSLAVRADEIPAGGRRFRVVASEAERRVLAAELGIPEVTDLSAEFDVRPLAGGAFSVSGSLVASVIQTDIVTLDPVHQAVNETVDLMLVAAENGGPELPTPTDPDESAESDFFQNGRIELGALTREHLALGLDPYPRAPGVEFPGHLEDDSPEASPFAALAKLKKGGE